MFGYVGFFSYIYIMIEKRHLQMSLFYFDPIFSCLLEKIISMSVAKVCKFQKERLEISYDCGETFEPTSETRKIEGREPVERNSTDCGFQISRMTVESGHTCNGYHKYTQLVDKISYDGEQTWDVIEGSNRIGALSERWSPDCCQLRTVSGTVCTEMFRKANVDIQEASLDGEHWIRTGKYTVNEYLDEYNLDCMNEYGVKILGVPASGVSGLSYFDYEMYTTSVSSSALTAVGANENYYILGCSSSSNTLCYEVTGNEIEPEYLPMKEAIENFKYIFYNDCCVNPSANRMYKRFAWDITAATFNSLEKIFISSGVTGTLGGEVSTYGGDGFSDSPNLTEIVGLENSKITGINQYYFNGCVSLKSVHLPITCTYLGHRVFGGCTSLSSVTIEAKDLTSDSGNSGYGQFASCTSLQSVTFPNDYYGKVFTLMFGECTGLTNVTLGNPDIISDSAFIGCTSLSSITLGNRVSTIGDRAFAECSSLKDVYIGQKSNILANVKNTSFPSGVTIHVPCEAYGYWHQAAEIDHPEVGWTIAIWGDTGCAQTQWVVSGTTCIGYDKYNLVVEEISYDGGSTWYPTGSQSAGTLIEADSIDCGYVPTDYYIKVEYPNGTLSAKTCNGNSQVTTADVTFGDSGYTKCWIGSCDSGTPVTSLAQGLFRTVAQNRPLQEVTLPYTLQSISNNAFQYCTGLTQVNIPSGVTTIGNYAFAACWSLSSLDIPNGVTNLGSGACQYCNSLSSVTIPNTVGTIGAYCFERSSGLTSVTIGSGVNYIGRAAFWGCSGLTSITCLATTPPTLYNPSDTDVFTNTNCPIYVPCEAYDAYRSAGGWSSLGNRIQPIDTTCRETRWIESGYTCNGCDKTPTEVEQVRYGTGGTWTNTGNQRTGQVQLDSEDCGCGTKFIFEYNDGTSYSSTCTSNYVSSDDVNYNSKKNNMVSAYINGECVSGISQSSFNSMQNLSSITVTEGVTTIGSDSFTDSTKLETVDLPSTLTKISYRAFMRCSSLSTVICRAITPPTLDGYDVFSVNAKNRKIYVPAESVSAYKSASKWSSYSSSIEAIPNS